MRISDWSSDVCSSDLLDAAPIPGARGAASSEDGAPANPKEGGDGKDELPAELKQSADKVIAAVKGITDTAKLEELDAAEKGRGDKARSTIRSEEHTSELQSLMRISYAVFCLKKKKQREH